MPDPLESLLLQRPPAVPQEGLPPGDPESGIGKLRLFSRGVMGDQEPGSFPAAAGAMLGAANPFGRARNVTTVPKVASKQAVKELVNLLLGRSKRVPLPNVYKPMSEADNSLSALMQTRTNSIPPPATVLNISQVDPMLKGQSRVIPREKGITKAHAARQKALGGDPYSQHHIAVHSKWEHKPYEEPRSTSHQIKHNTEVSNAVARSKPIAQQFGSLHTAGLKPITIREAKAMLDGPIKAFKAGILPKEELVKILNTNAAKLEAANKAFEAKDWEVYQQMMERAVEARRAK